MARQLHDFEGEVLKETDKALLVGIYGVGKEIWFPKAIIEDNKDGTFTVPISWAEEKEIL